MAVHDYTQQDLEKIQKIKLNYDLDKDRDVLALFAALQAGQIKFQSKVGMDFDDEIYQRAMQIKQGSATAKSKASKESKYSRKNDQILQSKSKKEKSKKKVVVLTKKEWILRRFLMVGLLLIGLTCLGYFAYYCIEAYQVDSEARRLRAIKNNQTVNDMYEDQIEVVGEGDQKKYYKVLDQYKSLYNQNKNLIGWIKIADTIIDYPVMQTTDNEYYLSHNISLEEDKNGTLFMDASCDIKKPSTNYIIYGHNMRSGKMFGALDKYENESYYEKHKIIEFDTIYEQSTYEIMYVFRSKVYLQDEVVFKYYQFIDANSADEFQSYMNEMAELSFYDTGVTAEYGDYLLTLSTCDYEEKEGRFVIVAKKIS